MAIQSQFTQFLRDERAQLLDAIEMFGTGRVGMHEARNGETVDVTSEWVTTLRERIGEIEQILREEGEAFDA